MNSQYSVLKKCSTLCKVFRLGSYWCLRNTFKTHTLAKTIRKLTRFHDLCSTPAAQQKNQNSSAKKAIRSFLHCLEFSTGTACPHPS